MDTKKIEEAVKMIIEAVGEDENWLVRSKFMLKNHRFRND